MLGSARVQSHAALPSRPGWPAGWSAQTLTPQRCQRLARCPTAATRGLAPAAAQLGMLFVWTLVVQIDLLHGRCGIDHVSPAHCMHSSTCSGAAVRWGSVAVAAHTANMTTNVLTKPSQDKWLSCRSEGMNSSGATAAVATAADRCSGGMPQAPETSFAQMLSMCPR